MNYAYNDAAHKHAVTSTSNGWAYQYDANGNMTRRDPPGSDYYDFVYDAENRLARVKKNNVLLVTFTYDGDGARIKAAINGGATTAFVGEHYEVTGSVVTKYYTAGGQRLALRQGSTLTYLLGDHLGSTSVSVAVGTPGSPKRQGYYPWGETRFATATLPTKYQFTGQYSYATGATGDFGLMYYRARWYDPQLGRFAQADSVMPGGVQGLDRYAYTSNNPIRYADPSGHIGKDNNNCADGWCGGTGSGAGYKPTPSSSGEQEITLTTAGESVEELYRLFLATDGWWSIYLLAPNGMEGGLDPFTLFLAVLLSRESSPLWHDKVGSGWGLGKARDGKASFETAANHWLWGWVEDHYKVSFGSLSEQSKTNAVFNLLGTMRSIEGVVDATHGVVKKTDDKGNVWWEEDGQYSTLSSDSARLVKVLGSEKNYYDKDLYAISAHALSNPTTGYWTWGNADSPSHVPADAVYRYDNFYILDRYER